MTKIFQFTLFELALRKVKLEVDLSASVKNCTEACIMLVLCGP